MRENIIVEGTAVRDDITIATEINLIKRQTAQACLRATIEIGQLLCEAKALIPFGSWGQWLEENVDYSQSTANNIMRIYNEYGEPAQIGFFEENRLEIFGSLTPSQAVALFALPQNERAAFVESHDMDNMSVRDIQAEIKELQVAKSAAELQRQAAEGQMAKLREESRQHREQAENAKRLADMAKKNLEEERRRSREEIARIQKEAEGKGQQTITVSADERKIRAEIKAEMEKDFVEREKKLEATGKKEIAKIQKEKRELAEKNARLEAQLTTAGAVAVQKFAIHFETLQNEFKTLQDIVTGIRQEDNQQADKLEGALVKILEAMVATIKKEV